MYSRSARARRLYRPARSEVLDERSAAEPSTEPGADEEELDGWLRERRRSWARLLARIYEVDPLVCP